MKWFGFVGERGWCVLTLLCVNAGIGNRRPADGRWWTPSGQAADTHFVVREPDNFQRLSTFPPPPSYTPNSHPPRWNPFLSFNLPYTSVGSCVRVLFCCGRDLRSFHSGRFQNRNLLQAVFSHSGPCQLITCLLLSVTFNLLNFIKTLWAN